MRAAFLSLVLGASGCGLILGESGGDGSEPLADAGTDATVDAGIDFEPCLSLTLFEDDFTSVERDPFWNLIGTDDGTVSQGPNGLSISVISGGQRGYTSGVVLNTADRSVTVEIDPDFDTDGTAAQFAVLDISPLKTRIFEVLEPDIRTRDVPETFNEIGPRNPVLDVHYRVRFSDARYFFETSPDGRMFRTLREVADADTAREVGFILSASTPSPTPANEVTFRNFRVGGRPPTGWCAASTLVDNFAGPDVSPLWNTTARGGGLVTADGELSLVVAAGETGIAGVESSGRYNLSAAPLRVQLGPVDSSGEAATIVEVRDSSLTFARFRIDGQMISAESSDRNTSPIAFDETLHGGLIFEASGSDLALLTAPNDGGAPVTMLNVVGFDHLLSVEVLIHVEAPAPVTSEAKSSIAGVNL